MEVLVSYRNDKIERLVGGSNENPIIKYDFEFENALMKHFDDMSGGTLMLTFFWKDQCNVEFSTRLLRFLSNRCIDLAISTQEM